MAAVKDEKTLAELAQQFDVVARQDWRVDAGKRFFSRRAQQGRHAERKAMIDRTHKLPISRQADVVGISRGSVYLSPSSRFSR